MGFSRQGYWSGLSLPPAEDRVASGLLTMTCPSWVALHGTAHSFIELHWPLHHDKAVIHEGDRFTDSMDMTLSELRETVEDRGVWRAAVWGCKEADMLGD